MAETHAVDDCREPDPRLARLGVLMWALKGHEFGAELDDDGTLRVAAPERPDYVLEVRCAPRAADGGRLWFESAGEPIAEADHITEALTAVKGLTARVRM
jgi:hypothetical protein